MIQCLLFFSTTLNTSMFVGGSCVHAFGLLTCMLSALKVRQDGLAWPAGGQCAWTRLSKSAVATKSLCNSSPQQSRGQSMQAREGV